MQDRLFTIQEKEPDTVFSGLYKQMVHSFGFLKEVMLKVDNPIVSDLYLSNKNQFLTQTIFFLLNSDISPQFTLKEILEREIEQSFLYN